MADNLGYTPGAGATVASDDVGGVHYQRIKVDGGGDGAAAPILGDSTNGLDVDVTRMPYTIASGSASALNGTPISQEVIGMRSWCVQVTGTFSAAFRFEGSNDNSTWTDLNWHIANSTTGPFNGSTGSTGIYVGALPTRYFRIRISSYTSGTVQADGLFSALASPLFVSASNVVNTVLIEGETAHDGGGSTTQPVAIAGYSSVVAPTDVNADGDVTRLWAQRNGALMTGGAAAVAATGSLASVVATGAIDTTGYQGVSVQIRGTWVGTMLFQHSNDGTNWFDCPMYLESGQAASTTSLTDDGQNGIYYAPARSLYIRLNRTVATSGTITYDVIKLAYPPAAPAVGGSGTTQISKSFNATTTQTGTDVWSPTAGKRIAISSVVIGAYATTAARLILWFGDNADTTYTAGTDQLVLAASFAPSSTSKPGLSFTPASPVFCTTVDRELHVTTDAGMSVDIAVHGFEW